MGVEDEGGDPACWLHLLGGHDGPSVAADDATLATLVRQMSDGVVLADRLGSIVLWNAAAERIFGWTAEEANGQSLDLIIPERQRNRHWDAYFQVMATGHTRYATDLLQVPALHRDGRRLSIAFTVTLLTDPDGEVRGIAAVIRDETDRRAAAQAVRQVTPSS